jgi:hypothetical protein
MTDREELKSLINECIEEIYYSENEYSFFSSLNDKINKLLDLEDYDYKVQIAQKTLDKFDEYIKSMHKLNEMVNELKGIVSLSRASLNKTIIFEMKNKDIL